MSRKQLPIYHTLNLGCDPELFVSAEVGKVRKRLAIIGSELIIPPSGLQNGGVVRDGVQIELHPHPIGCRANLAAYLTYNFRALRDRVALFASTMKMPLTVDFRSVVKLSKGDLAKLSPVSRELGCMPSKNAYGRKHIQRNGQTYLWRSAAGHLHLGFKKDATFDPDRFAKLMDVMVGNTCVMVDRNPLNVERRKTYGRAGEYRIPSHGFEYRTLSNFWLYDYKLMSMVMAFAKMAFVIYQAKATQKAHGSNAYTAYCYDAEEMLMKDVDLSLIEQAINENNWELARSNFERWVQPFVEQLNSIGLGLDAGNLPSFMFFIDEIRKAELAGHEQPLARWFTHGDPLSHWCSLPDGHGRGWESFLGAVAAERTKMVMPTIGGLVSVPPAPQPLPTTYADPHIIFDTPIIGRTV